MFKTIKNGDIFQSDADILVNPINLQGTMGAGLAKSFRDRFPINNAIYEQYCRFNKLKIGEVLAISENGKIIVNFPTKDDWRNPSKYEYIETGMKDLCDILSKMLINKSVAFPKLGCGLGKLEWDKVRSIIVKHLESIPEEKRGTYYFYE